MLPALPQAGAPITIQDVARWEAIVADRVRSVDDIVVLQEWRDQAAALDAYLRSKDMHQPMLGAQRRVEARIGQLLPTHQGNKLPTHAEEVIQRGGDRADFRILAHALNSTELLKDEEWRRSRRKLVSHLKDLLGLYPPVVTPGFPDGPFRAIVIDPPWPIEKIELERRPVESIDMDYQTLSLKKIGELPIKRLANEEGTHVYLWVTHKFLPEGLRLFAGWGVRYECVLTWVKPTAQPLWWRFLTEHCLFGKIGALPPMKKGEAVSFTAPQQRHSHKPEAFFDLVRRVSPEPRLTMFDGARAGFERWGHVHG